MWEGKREGIKEGALITVLDRTIVEIYKVPSCTQWAQKVKGLWNRSRGVVEQRKKVCNRDEANDTSGTIRRGGGQRKNGYCHRLFEHETLLEISTQYIKNFMVLGYSVCLFDVKYNTIQYNTIQYNTIQYNTIQYNTIQYNTIQ